MLTKVTSALEATFLRGASSSSRSWGGEGLHNPERVHVTVRLLLGRADRGGQSAFCSPVVSTLFGTKNRPVADTQSI